MTYIGRYAVGRTTVYRCHFDRRGNIKRRYNGGPEKLTVVRQFKTHKAALRWARRREFDW